MDGADDDSAYNILFIGLHAMTTMSNSLFQLASLIFVVVWIVDL